MMPLPLESFRAPYLLLLIMGVMIGGCDRQAAPGDAAPTVEPISTATPEAAPSPTPAPSAVEGVGKICDQDRHCTGYLRCMNQACAVPPAVTGEAHETTPVVVFRREQDPESEELGRFFVELAISPEEQRRGLMYRRHMEPDWGMVFIYPRDSRLSFWMKNTLIPLDMIFVHSSGEVMGVVEGAEPLTETPRTVDKPSRFVVELNAGKAREHGIETGTWMSTKYVDEAHSPTP